MDFLRSEYPNGPHAEMPVPPEDDVIVDDNAELRRDIDNLLCHVDIGSGVGSPDG